ncbi:IclR family transcriptional regulator [Pelagibacterium sp.]|uniref:IclR family transcriptional regulator n=1 Tax=Pelagibacterium sp. TaxID=1967288 RepID=UPI003A922D08
MPLLRRLRDQTRETVNLGIVDNAEVVVLTQVESREIMRAITKVGGRAPMVNSGMGKAILASYPDADVAAAIGRSELRKVTEKSITSISGMLADIAAIRKRGYALDDEEFVIGLRCAAAVVYNTQSEALCAISISGLAMRVSDERLHVLGRLIAGAAEELTVMLGGQSPAK